MNLIPITDVCDFQGGTQPPKSEWSSKPLDGYVRMLQIRDFTQSEKNRAEYVQDTTKLKKCNKNDILIGRYGASVGKILTGLSGAYNVAIVRSVPDERKLRKDFLYYLLKGPIFQNFILNLGGRAAQAGFNKTDLTKFEIPLLSLDDQKRIAYLLSKVEWLITRRKQHLQQLDDLLQSVFLEMFGNPMRNEKGWDKPELKQFGKISTGNTPPRKDPSNYSAQHIEWIKTNNISTSSVFISQAAEYLSKIGATKARAVTKGALMVACIAGSVESIGRAALTDRTVTFNQQINAIQPKKDVNPLYLYVLFKISKAYIQSHASKGMKKILTKGVFQKITMIKPPVDLQNQFATILEKVEALKSRYQQSLTDMEKLYGALSQKAFKGELDLSQIPLLTKMPERTEEKSKAEDDQLVEPSFKLPEPTNLTVLQSLEGRRVLLEQWLNAWLEHLGESAFSAQSFMDAAQQRLWELVEDELPEWGVDEYNELKSWVFAQIESGKLKQTRNIIRIKEKRQFGNQVILRPRKLRL